MTQLSWCLIGSELGLRMREKWNQDSLLAGNLEKVHWWDEIGLKGFQLGMGMGMGIYIYPPKYPFPLKLLNYL